MSTITNEQLITALKWRYATKQFDPDKKINPQDWQTLEDALVLTPSSFGLQPWKFIVVTDPATKEKLRAVSWGQSQVTDCSYLVAFAIPTVLKESGIDAYIERIAEVRGSTVESLAKFRDTMVGNLIGGKRNADLWATEQAFIALGNFMTSAALLGIDTCALGGIESEKYDEILGLKQQELKTVVACAAGYRAASDKYATLPKVRFKNEDVIIRR
jgi:nitroreductase